MQEFQVDTCKECHWYCKKTEKCHVLLPVWVINLLGLTGINCFSYVGKRFNQGKYCESFVAKKTKI